MFWWLMFGCAMGGGDCSSGDLKKVTSALGQVPAEHKVALTLQGVSEACPKAPAWLGTLHQVPPGLAPMVAMRGVAEDPTTWARACAAENPYSVVSDAIALSPAERGAFLHRACKVDWASEAELGAARGDVLTAIVLADVLKGHDVERRLYTRTVAGVR